MKTEADHSTALTGLCDGAGKQSGRINSRKAD